MSKKHCIHSNIQLWIESEVDVGQIGEVGQVGQVGQVGEDERDENEHASEPQARAKEWMTNLKFSQGNLRARSGSQSSY